MALIHHYVQKGVSDEFILNLSSERRAFYEASAELEIEKEESRFKVILAALGVKIGDQ